MKKLQPVKTYWAANFTRSARRRDENVTGENLHCYMSLTQQQERKKLQPVKTYWAANFTHLTRKEEITAG